jgi:hypothetical protein
MFKKKTKKKVEPLISDPKKIATALEVLFATPYISQKKLYWENFVRGMAFAAGGVIGASVLIALLLWILSLFDTVPLIGPVLDHARDSIQNTQK